MLLGWTRDPSRAGPEHLLNAVVARSGILTAMWTALPAAPPSSTVLANFLCRQNCTAALVIGPASTDSSDTAVLAVNGVDTSCNNDGRVAELQWSWITGTNQG